jgi:hypothetical protein
MNQSTALSPNNFKDIGLMVYRINPEFANRCVNMMAAIKPEFTDISLIPKLFTYFCDHNNISSINSKVLSKTEYVYLRFVFTAIIIKLYNPELICDYPPLAMKRQLRKELSKLFNIHPSWVSQKVRVVCFHLKIYEEFENDVITTISVLRHNLNQSLKN